MAEGALHETEMLGEEIIAPLPRITLQAFCETPAVAATMQAAVADRRMDKARSSRPMRWLTALGVRHSSSAAQAKLRWRAATRKV